ncbi:conserved hypothetical protein [Ixodes scapularis]|uniref:FAD-binding FR-type domain-containing protein n=1 Tax=Ixodes scapularis TaxID=6945 RepID=B7PQD9_IXOSC|nr:conserved hypothetical protein [Ixodes scapularis]|eukprot:XP_002435981.1 conserved hypothetical protein [Ixodes scapularis]
MNYGSSGNSAHDGIRYYLQRARELSFDEANSIRAVEFGQVLSRDIYTAFELVGITAITDKCCQYTFAIPHRRSLQMNVGDHLIMRASYNGECITRQYTPISPSSQRGTFEVLIKIYPNGKMSKYIDSLTEGSLVEWRGPFGELNYKPNSHKQLILLAAGTGIAPMIQILRHITDNEDDETLVRLLFGVARYDEIYLKKELDDLRNFWNVSILYCLSQVGDGSCQGEVRR